MTADTALRQSQITDFVLGTNPPLCGWTDGDKKLGALFAQVLCERGLTRNQLGIFRADVAHWVGLPAKGRFDSSIGFGLFVAGEAAGHVRANVTLPDAYFHGMWHIGPNFTGELIALRDGDEVLSHIEDPRALLHQLVQQVLAERESPLMSVAERARQTAFVLSHFTTPRHGWYPNQRKLAEHFAMALARAGIAFDGLRVYDADAHSWFGIAPSRRSRNAIGFGLATPWPEAPGTYVCCQIHGQPQWQGLWHMWLKVDGTLEVYKNGLLYANMVADPVSFIHDLLVRAVAP